MELSQLYQAILASLNVKSDEDGLLSLVYGDKSFPATVEGKRLVLPTKKILADGLGDKLIAFHPLSENVLRGESPVLKKFKTYVTTRLDQVLSELFVAFTDISAEHKLHSKLSPDQKELLLAMPDADERTVDDLGKIFEAMQHDSRRKLMSIYLKRGGKLRLEKFSRTAVVNFPIIAEFENEQRTIYGVKCRVKDYAGFAKLFEYILPNADGTGYSVGSNDKDVPYFDALLQAFVKVATQLNKRVTLFKKHLPHADQLHIDLSWLDQVQDWAAFRGQIPPLAGNDGATVAEEAASQAEETAAVVRAPVFDPSRAAAAATSHIQQHTQPAHQQPPAQHQEPEVRRTSNGINWQDVVAGQQRRSLQPAVIAQPPPVPYGFQQQPMMYPGQPGQPVMMPYAEPPPPGFGPPGQPAQPPGIQYDAYGRPMIMPPPQGMPPMVDQWGRPMQMGPGGQMFQNVPPGGFAPPGFAPPMVDPRLQGAGMPGTRQPSFGVQQQFYGQPAMFGAQGGYPQQPMYPQQPAANWTPPPLNTFAQGTASVPVYRT
jgi:hypothetical protein